MPPFFDREIDLILWLRGVLPGMVGPFEIFTFLGNEMFFLLLLPFVYWCLDRRTGARLTVLFLLSAYFNGLAKLIFDLPRPIDVAADRLAPLFPQGIEAAREAYDATSTGFPSGHTQNAVTVWGFLASRLYPKERPRLIVGELLRPVLLAGAALLIVLVPLSRVYLGVHYPHDLVGGYILGALVLALYLWLQPQAEAWLADRSLAQQLGVAAVLPLLLLLVAAREEGVVTASATLLGMGVGFALERRWVGFEASPDQVERGGWRVAVRYAVGIAVMFVLYAGLKAAFAALDPATEALVLALRFIRYTLMGIWGGLGGPWLFVTVGLAGRRDEAGAVEVSLLGTG
jgi:membrane-associated phospholipid phosphatase